MRMVCASDFTTESCCCGDKVTPQHQCRKLTPFHTVVPKQKHVMVHTRNGGSTCLELPDVPAGRVHFL